jgi:hypothetical protein
MLRQPRVGRGLATRVVSVLGVELPPRLGDGGLSCGAVGILHGILRRNRVRAPGDADELEVGLAHLRCRDHVPVRSISSAGITVPLSTSVK